jgi:hypothetical protein
MVAAALTEQMIGSGATLIRKLDERGLAPDAAFWFYVPDRQEWSLVIAEAKLTKKGPRWIYNEIRDAISESSGNLPGLSLDAVSVVKPDVPIVSLLMAAIHTGPGLVGIRFSNNVIDGTVVEDAYIYRLTDGRRKG